MQDTIDYLKIVINNLRQKTKDEQIAFAAKLQERLSSIGILEKLQWDIEERLECMIKDKPL